MFDSPKKLMLGLATGVLFGFVLQKARVSKYETIVGAFQLKDFTAVKVMGTAAVIGSLGVSLLVQSKLAPVEVKPARVGAIVLGGVLFGVGIVFFGYCPGTGIVAAGEGKRDAFAGVLGMMSGAALYVLFYESVAKLQKSFPDLGKLTFPKLTHSEPLLWSAGFATIAGITKIVSQKHEKRIDLAAN